MRKRDECDLEKLGTLESTGSENTIGILGDGWWPEMVKQDGDEISKKCVVQCTWYGTNVVLKVSLFGAPSRKYCVVNGQRTKASNQ